MEGRSPVSFFSDQQNCCFSGSWLWHWAMISPNIFGQTALKQISLEELLVKPSPADLCQCQGQQCGQQCPALFTTGTVPAGACSALQAAREHSFEGQSQGFHYKWLLQSSCLKQALTVGSKSPLPSLAGQDRHLLCRHAPCSALTVISAE